MIVLIADPARADDVRCALQGLGLWVSPQRDAQGRTLAFSTRPHSTAVSAAVVERVAGVAGVLTEGTPWRRVEQQRANGARVAGIGVGPGCAPVLMTGPCAVESPDQIHGLAQAAKRAGARFLRGGAFKPRSSPYSFAGHGEEALDWLAEAARKHGLRVVTEALSVDHVEAVARRADLIQVGARTMQAYELLHAIGRTGLPVLLKRAPSATVDEWMGSAEHLLNAGARDVIFCERGVTGIDPGTRYQQDTGAIALLSHVHGQTVIADPSHAAGRRDLVVPLARAAMAAGAHGLMVEMHNDPRTARSDGPQALAPDDVAALWKKVETT